MAPFSSYQLTTIARGRRRRLIHDFRHARGVWCTLVSAQSFVPTPTAFVHFSIDARKMQARCKHDASLVVEVAAIQRTILRIALFWIFLLLRVQVLADAHGRNGFSTQWCPLPRVHLCGVETPPSISGWWHDTRRRSFTISLLGGSLSVVQANNTEKLGT